MTDDDTKCGDCSGRTVDFRGRGQDTQYRVCPHHTKPGHLTKDQVAVLIQERMRVARPSGRFA